MCGDANGTSARPAAGALSWIFPVHTRP